jgi:hypothetical protein
MVEALKLVVPLRRWLTSTFFSLVQMLDTDTVVIDTTKSGRRLARFVHPDHEGVAKQKKGFKTNIFKIPYIKELITLTAHEMLQRQPGQPIFSDGNFNISDLAVMKLAEEMQESSDAIDRRIEWMVAQLMQTGKVRCVGEGMDEEIDFLLPTDHNVTLSGNDLWSATTTAAPLQKMKDWKRVVAKKGKTITDWILGSQAYDYFMNNTVEVKGANSAFNQMKVNIGQIDVDQIDGVTRIAQLPEIGRLWSYEEWFADDQADYKEQPLIDPKKVIGIAGGARRSMYYGLIKDLDASGRMAKFPKSWKSENPSKIMGLLQSAPLPAIHDVEQIFVAKVIA